MRSSKKRSRSNQNRPRSLGNIVNRVFDSSGPEGKVRGTPQQIIEKYHTLARDAQLSNDRVAAENFLQHAEHYTRLLAEAQRELAAEQEARQQQNNANGGNHQNGGRERGEWRDRGEYRDRGDQPREPRAEIRDPGSEEQPQIVDVIDFAAGDAVEVDTGLVDLPETRTAAPAAVAETPAQPAAPQQGEEGDRPARNSRSRGPRGDKPPARNRKAAEGEAAPGADLFAAEGERPARNSRGPRKPRAAKAEGEAPSTEPSAAAE